MLFVGLIRRSWETLLAALPTRLLGRLDAWARDAAERRAERRIRHLARR